MGGWVDLTGRWVGQLTYGFGKRPPDFSLFQQALGGQCVGGAVADHPHTKGRGAFAGAVFNEEVAAFLLGEEVGGWVLSLWDGRRGL